MSWYALVIVKSQNDMLWFNIESDHMTIFLLKFFKNVKKVEKLLEKGIFSLFGNIPELMNVKLMGKVDYEFTPYEEYQTKVKGMCKEIRLK